MRRVLLVDDDEAVRTALSLFAKRTGFRTYIFSGDSLPARPGGLIVSLYRVTASGSASMRPRTGYISCVRFTPANECLSCNLQRHNGATTCREVATRQRDLHQQIFTSLAR